jgi:hypothetical protein
MRSRSFIPLLLLLAAVVLMWGMSVGGEGNVAEVQEPDCDITARSGKNAHVEDGASGEGELRGDLTQAELRSELELARAEIGALRAETCDRLKAIKRRLGEGDLSASSRIALHAEARRIKLDTELRILKIRLAVAEMRGMERHAREIREAIGCIESMDGTPHDAAKEGVRDAGQLAE